jgi:predicted transposase YdaD
MQESVIYQDILHKGEQRGEQRGEQKGKQNTIIRQLTRRFGEIDSSLTDKIKLLSLEELDNLAEELLDFATIDDLVTWFNQQELS